MKSPKKNGIGEVVTDYGRRVMKIFKKGLLQRSLFDFYGDIKADSVKIKESSSVPGTPVDGDGGVVYIKSADGKLYFKSNEVSEVELSASDTVLTSEQVQDIVGGMLVGTETRIGVTYDDTNGRIDFVVDDMTADTNTQNTTTLSFVDSSNDVILRNTTGGAGSGTDDIKFVAGSNITLTHTDADNITISSTDTNTVYSEATGSAEGLMSIAHHDKLDGIEASADVTDTANVTAAGALMDSELTDLAGVKGVTISTLQVKPSEGAFANGDKTKLNGIATGATANVGDVTLTGTQTLSGNKTLNNLRIENEESDGAPEIRFYEGSDNGTNYASLKASDSIASNYEVSLPTSTGTIQLQPSEGAFANGDKTKLDGIAAGATADQTNVTGSSGSCTGNAATATALTTGNKDITGTLNIKTTNTTGNPFISFSQTTTRRAFIQLADNNAGFENHLRIASEYGPVSIAVASTDGSDTDTVYLMVEPTGVFKFGAVDADAVLTTDGNMTFRIDADNDETGQKFSFENNASTEVGSLDESGNLSVTGKVLPGITYVKILPSDFVPDDVGRPAMIDDTGSDRWLESHGTAKLFAYVDIPVGFKATHVDIYGSATSAVTVYEADVNSKTVTSKGTGNIGTQINITDVNSDATNYILIELAQASGEEVYGGKLTIAKI